MKVHNAKHSVKFLRDMKKERDRKRGVPIGKKFLVLLRKNMLIIIIMVAAAVNID